MKRLLKQISQTGSSLGHLSNTDTFCLVNNVLSKLKIFIPESLLNIYIVGSLEDLILLFVIFANCHYYRFIFLYVL